MKKLAWTIFGLVLTTTGVMAQGTLEFNQVKIVGSTQETVPAGKVWKITSVYGDAFNCITPASPYVTSTSTVFLTKYAGFVGSSFKVNGNTIYSFREWKGGTSTPETTVQIYDDNVCTVAYGTGHTRSVLTYDIEPNPNLFPLWAPAGATVKTDASSVFLSVVEFNVVP